MTAPLYILQLYDETLIAEMPSPVHTQETGEPASTPPPPMPDTMPSKEAPGTTPEDPFLDAAIIWRGNPSFSPAEARLDIKVCMADCPPVVSVSAMRACVFSLLYGIYNSPRQIGIIHPLSI